MSRKNYGRRYNLANVKEFKRNPFGEEMAVKKINPFSNGFKEIRAIDWIAKNESEKYRRMKK